MKKYVKPDLYYENFELSQHIATCMIDINSAEGSCTQIIDGNFWPEYGGQSVFTESNCEVDYTVLGVYCYTTGTNVQGRLFNS